MPVRRFPNFLRSLSIAFLILSLAGCDLLNSLINANTYTVKRISDGDTLTVTDSSGKDTNVRFACIDAAEVPHTKRERQSRKVIDKNQFKWGYKAQERVQQLVTQGGNSVLLTVTDTDQYGRKISEVRLPDGTFIQEILVVEGLAQVYRPYLKNCPSAATVEQAEAQAKKARRGVWRDPQFVEPWEYRRRSK